MIPENIIEYEVMCSCDHHSLVLSYDTEWGFLDIAFWKRGHSRYSPIRQKLRHIFKILRDGHPYSDEVLLDKEDARRLWKHLTEIIDYMENDTTSDRAQEEREDAIERAKKMADKQIQRFRYERRWRWLWRWLRKLCGREAS